MRQDNRQTVRMLPHGLFYYVSLRRSAPRDSVFHFLYNPQPPKAFTVVGALSVRLWYQTNVRISGRTMP
nr:MAG TPA: hypothetical protein [Caudoviricetes sp.]